MQVTNPGGGFVFLSIALGILSLIMVVTTFNCAADHDDRTKLLMWITIPVVIAFLFSGFLGFAGVRL
jgi:hypothetical protein